MSVLPSQTKKRNVYISYDPFHNEVNKLGPFPSGFWENFPNLAKGIDFQEVQEAQRVPKKLVVRRNTPRHIIIKLPKIKDKERCLKATREKETVIYKGVPIRLSADFSKGTLQARRDWQEVFKVMKSKDL